MLFIKQTSSDIFVLVSYLQLSLVFELHEWEMRDMNENTIWMKFDSWFWIKKWIDKLKES